MNVTRRGLLGLAALGAGSLALSACQSGDKGTQADSATARASLGPGDGYSKDDSGRSTTYRAKGRELLTGLGSFETICQPRAAQGRIEQLTYQTHSYVWEEANPGQEFLVNKVINVWLPADYDASRTYDVLYLMHGTGHEGASYWLTDEEDCHGSQTRGLLDGMVEDGLIKDVIVACPSYYSFPVGEEPADVLAYHQADPHADDWPRLFWKELRKSVIPLVESTYPTHAAGDVSDAGLAASRDHRGFAGLSRGSMTSVNSAMMHCLDLFGWIGSYSGIWADFDEFKGVLEGQYAELPVRYWYNGNGSKMTPRLCMEYARDYVLRRYPDQEVVMVLHRESCKGDGTERYAVHLGINRTNLQTGLRLDEGPTRRAASERAKAVRALDERYGLRQLERGKANSLIHARQPGQEGRGGREGARLPDRMGELSRHLRQDGIELARSKNRGAQYRYYSKSLGGAEEAQRVEARVREEPPDGYDHALHPPGDKGRDAHTLGDRATLHRGGVRAVPARTCQERLRSGVARHHGESDLGAVSHPSLAGTR